MIRRALIRATSRAPFDHFENVLGRSIPVYEIRGGLALWWVALWKVTGFAIDLAVFTKRPLDRAHLAHELTHIKQAMTVRLFSLRYAAEWLWHWAHQPLQPKEAYRQISYEVEARAAKAAYLEGKNSGF